MMKNYRKTEEIATDIKTHGLEEYIEFDNNGRYEFYKCKSCEGPMLGHQQNKCRHKDPYKEQIIKNFENWLKRNPELKKQLSDKKQEEKARANHHQVKQAEIQANMLGDTVARLITGITPREGNTANPTTQLIKARLPPIWTGQRFNKWKVEIEKWNQNNKLTDEDKFVDLLESLKKNDSIKEFVTKKLID